METHDQLMPSRHMRRTTFTRRTLMRGHGLPTKPLKTSITVLITSEEWMNPDADLLAFDRRVHEAEDRAHLGHSFLFSVSGPRTILRNAAKQIFTRYQRLFQRRNRHSRSNHFTSVLARHRALHPLHKPLVRADFDHALDVWQWVLRLNPDASGALQIAALFHDVERLASEADVRVEQAAENYLTFKRQHAQIGAQMLREALAECALPAEQVARAAALVERHEQPGDDPELNLLNDADGLSFFSLNSSGYLKYFGAEQAANKVDYTIARMSPRARELLTEVRLEPFMQELVRQTLARRTQPM